MNDSTLSTEPIKYNEEYALLYRSREVQSTLDSLDDVYNSIKQKLKDRKVEIMMTQRLKELKEKYKVTINKTGIKI